MDNKIHAGLIYACEQAITRLKELDKYREVDSSATCGLLERAITEAKRAPAQDFRFLGLMAHACVMWIFNATPSDFETTFGDVGAHLWSKFEGQYNREEGRLICGMDYFNAAKLAHAAYEKYIPELLENYLRAEEAQKVAEYFSRRRDGAE